MGSNPIILDDDEVRPTLVCNSNYWCPYQKYEDVEFEHVLKSEYFRLYETRNGDDRFGFILFVFTVIGICFVICTKIFDHSSEYKMELFEQTAALIK